MIIVQVHSSLCCRCVGQLFTSFREGMENILYYICICNHNGCLSLELMACHKCNYSEQTVIKFSRYSNRACLLRQCVSLQQNFSSISCTLQVDWILPGHTSHLPWRFLILIGRYMLYICFECLHFKLAQGAHGGSLF